VANDLRIWSNENGRFRYIPPSDAFRLLFPETSCKKTCIKIKVKKFFEFTSFVTVLKDPPMRIGYARVSTADQNLDMQRDALSKAGCEKIIEDTASGSKPQRSGLERARELLRQGDVLVVWRLDRLGRSIKHLIELMTELEQQGIGFQSLQESIDTTTPGGKLVFHVFAALAEFERNVIRERTSAGLAAARARGRKGGRPLALDNQQKALAVDLYRQRKHNVAEICRTVGISRPTLYRYVREANGNE
jgi:DNA invertase Pin-like site-specific DNA recombinase